uniref:Uncharacterized protein n=1 Tax=Arundo donax TaxID=35708 RepID=A0A0A9G2E5_ARUDO
MQKMAFVARGSQKQAIMYKTHNELERLKCICALLPYSINLVSFSFRLINHHRNVFNFLAYVRVPLPQLQQQS